MRSPAYLPPDAIPEPELLQLNLTSVSHGKCFEETGSLPDLQAAIVWAERCLVGTRPTHLNWSCLHNNLGYLLYRRYVVLGSTDDLSRAVEICGKAVTGMKTDDPDRGLYLRNYGEALGDTFMIAGDVEALNTAVKSCEDAILAAEPGDERVNDWRSALGIWLWRRFERCGMMDDLERAIKVGEEAAMAERSVPSWRAASLANLANSVSARFSRTGYLGDIRRVIWTLNQAIRLLDQRHPHRPGVLIQFADALSERAKLPGQSRDIERALNRSVEATEQALDLISPEHPSRAEWLGNLSATLGQRYDRLNTPADLDRAIDVGTQAAALVPLGHRDRGRIMQVLGNRYLSRSQKLSQSRIASASDFQMAMSCFQKAWDCPNTDPMYRITLGLNLGRLLAMKSAWAEASTILDFTVGLLPRVSPRSLQHTDKQHILAEYSGLASLAAAAALNAGRSPEHALQQLELGRGVISGLLLEMRSDLSELQERFPDLAAKFGNLRDELDVPAAGPTPMQPSVIASQAGRRLDADKELSRLLDQIRSKEGFETFLCLPTAAEMRAAADPDPIVVINLSPHRCDAFLVQHDKITVVRLPRQAYIEASLQAARLRKSGLEASASEITPVLEWLWTTVARPSLDGLGIRSPATQEAGNETKIDWPHVWWVPTGVLSKLPLHAAGRYHPDQPGSVDGQSVLDRVMSSYSVSVKTLIYSRRLHMCAATAAAPLSDQALLVAMEDTPGLLRNGRLPSAKAEVDMLSSICPSLHLRPIIPPTRKVDVLNHLATCRIFHFAGHGSSDAVEPSKSCLMLEDWKTAPLEVGDLRNRHLQVNNQTSGAPPPPAPPFLGYLSACSTGANDAVKLADEGIHLVSALQLAGFRNVIGTLWEVSDRHCVDVARKVYETIAAEGMTDRAVCRGLHIAVRMLRDGGFGKKDGPRKAQLGLLSGSAAKTERLPKFYWVPYVRYGI